MDNQSLKNNPPSAEKIEKKLVTHGDTRIDEYYWLRERESEMTLKYLEAENTYRKKEMAHTEELQEQLFQEIKGRIKEDDQSVPYYKNGYWYYVRYETGLEHPIYCRKKEVLSAPEEILLDANVEAEQYDYYQVGGLSVSQDNEWLAYGVDTLSRRIYQIYIKEIKTGKVLKYHLENTTGSAVWSNDGQHLFYTTKDSTLRPHKVFRHRLHSDPKEDTEVYHESDPTFVCSAYKSKSQAYIMIGCHSTVSNEYYYLPSHQPTDSFKVIQKRERGLEYSVAHFDQHWYIRTNKDEAVNFKLMRCPIDKTQKEFWQDLIPHRSNVFLEGLEIFKDYLVLDERSEGLNRLRIMHWDGTKDYYLDFDNETYTLAIGNNPDFNSQKLRFAYSSLTTPSSVYEYDMITGERELLKQQEVVGGYREDLYEAKRLWATADDGKKVAVSLVYRKDLLQTNGNPSLLYGYGSYGYTIDPSFSSVRLSLLDRGFIFAIAHIRGGQYLGRSWYDDGRMLNKKNSFSDFIACGEMLRDSGLCSANGLFAMGGSAGGLLMGAVINLRPDLFQAVVAAVPFVDVVTTMLDESIPLTTGEYDEWGNPNDSEYYHYIKSYSPYDNIKAQDYPALLITSGLHDSQVQYWEPAKWCARLRDRKTNDKPLYFYCNMKTGHGGASGRFESIRETAMEYAFILDQAGINE